MRCRVCNVLLSDFESTRRNADTGEYLDTCCKCLAYIKTPTVDNYSLMDSEDDSNMEQNIDTEEFTWMVDIEE